MSPDFRGEWVPETRWITQFWNSKGFKSRKSSGVTGSPMTFGRTAPMVFFRTRRTMRLTAVGEMSMPIH